MRRRNKGALKDRDKSVSAGRSKGLVKEYQPRFCGVVINQGRQGKSRAQIAMHLGVTRKRLQVWVSAHPDFAEAMEIAEDYALAYWEGKAQKSLTAKHFQANILNKLMSSRYPKEYGERSTLELDTPPLTTITRRIIRPSGEDITVVKRVGDKR